MLRKLVNWTILIEVSIYFYFPLVFSTVNIFFLQLHLCDINGGKYIFLRFIFSAVRFYFFMLKVRSCIYLRNIVITVLEMSTRYTQVCFDI
ncbi:hypothetical protein Hanom_Chr12g01125231 [Helianthus anomalus]